MVSKVGIVRDPIYLKHSNGPGHPESAERLMVLEKMLSTFPLRDHLLDIPARDATIRELSWVHETAYIERIEKTKYHPFTRLDMDTGATSDSYDAAVRAAGGAMEAVRGVLEGRCGSSFAFLRPPGHHAESDRSMGFCIFNNIAIAARYAIQVHQLERILIIDWDVHHGNGTMHQFYESDQVLYFSIHQFPHYPGTGHIGEIGQGRGKGFTVNVPLPGSQGDYDYLTVFQKLLRPIACEFSPELILVSAGFDAHEGDPLAHMLVTSRGFAEMTKVVLELAEQSCKGRTVFILEGGYDLVALSDSVSQVLGALIGQSAARSRNGVQSRSAAAGRTVQPLDGPLPLSPHTRNVLEKLTIALAPFWVSASKDSQHS